MRNQRLAMAIEENQGFTEKCRQEKHDTQRHPWSPMFVYVMVVVFLILPVSTFSMGSLNTPAQHIKDFINATYLERMGEVKGSSDIDTLFGLLIALSGLGAAVGCFLAGFIMDAFGRKYGIIIAAVVTIVGTLTMAFSKSVASFEMLYVGRVITGVATGLASTIAPAYVVEICLPEIKSTVALICQLIQSFAIMCANVAGFEELLGTSELWPFLLGLPAVVCGLQLVLIPFCPESPRYLLMKKGALDDAKKGLQWLRKKQDVDDDIDELHRELEESKLQSQVSTLRLFITPSLRRPLVVAFVMGWYQNWCGVLGILMFSTQLFQESGMTDRVAKYATSGTGLIFFLGNLGTSFLMARFNRKTLYKIGTVGMGLCCIVIAFTMMYKHAESAKYINVVTSLLLIGFYSIGPACLFWIILTEMFPHSARGAGLGIGVQNVYLSFFAHCYIFPEILRIMGMNSFFAFAGINALMTIFIHFVIPETKNRSVIEILKMADNVNKKMAEKLSGEDR